MFKIYSTFAFKNDMRIISHVDGNDFVSVQGWEGFFSFHHMIRSSRVYEKCCGLRNSFHEGMSSFLLDVPIMIISLSNTLWNIDIVPLEEKIHLIKKFLHTGMFMVKSLPTIGTLEFFFALDSFLFVLIWAERILLLLVLLFWI